MVGIDSTVLSLLIHPKAKAGLDPSTHKPVERLAERVEQLIADLSEQDERILIPTPVLAEFLVLAGKDASAYLDKLSTMKTFIVQAFDQTSAVEVAALELGDRVRGDKRGGLDAPWQKVKVDRQIVATAKVYEARCIYADDPDIRKIAERIGMAVVSTWELPIPPSKTPLFDDLPESHEREEAVPEK